MKYILMMHAPYGKDGAYKVNDGSPAVTDGPAYEIAARASAAPGPDGAPLGIPIEVRRVMSAPSTDGQTAAGDRGTSDG